MELGEWILIVLLIAMPIGVIVRVHFQVSKKPATLQPAFEELFANRQAYNKFYRNIADGRADGFVVGFTVLRAKDGSTESSMKPLKDVYTLFKQRNKIDSDQYQDGDVLDMGFWGALPCVVVLVGHPIPLSEENQIQAVKKLTTSWYACVDELYKGARKGLVSISHGDINYLKPDFSSQRNFGAVMGNAFEHAVVTMSDAYLTHKWFGAMRGHKIAVDIEAANKLEMRLPGTVMVSYETPECQMFLGDYTDNS